MRVKKITELNRLTIEEFREVSKLPVSIVLDNVRSLNNIGSIFRCSDAFSIECIYLCGITATPPHADIHKTALGAEDSVQWKYYENTLDAVMELKNENYIVCALEQTTNSCLLHQFQYNSNSKYAIVVGNEVKGVQQQVVDNCDYAIEIPQVGTKHSLNVSVATGIVIWDFFKNLYTNR